MKMVTSQDSKVIQGKLIKMKSINNSPAVEVGEIFTGHYFTKPTLDEGFIFFPIERLAIPFQTSRVTKIIDEFTFETKNSVYYLIDKVRERDITIEELLK